MSNDPKSAGRKPGLLGRLFGRTDAPETAPPPAADTPTDDVPVHDTTGHDGEQPSDRAAASPLGATTAAVATPEPAPAGPPARQGWLQRLASGLAKTSSQLADGITGVFSKRRLDATTLDDLEDLLIQADLGVETATRITGAISKTRYDKGIAPEDVRAILAAEVEQVLAPVARPLAIDPTHAPQVILFVGVNGAGKTTTIGKLAAQLGREGRKVMIVAGDTFRAAAIEQLTVWGERSGATVVKRELGADAAGLAFDALEQARREAYDVVLMDTAGRLQNKQGLMDELAKIVRVMHKFDAQAPHDVVLVLDATTGQNAMAQVEVFRDKAGVTGLVMTKLDGTARGGILVAIAAKHKLPVHLIGVGEGLNDLAAFDAKDFARAIAAS